MIAAQRLVRISCCGIIRRDLPVTQAARSQSRGGAILNETPPGASLLRLKETPHVC